MSGRFPSTRWSVVEAARGGDAAAVEELARRYRPAVLSYLSTRSVGAEDAEDVAQDVFLRLLAPEGALARVDPRLGRFRSLLRSITRNALGDHLDRFHAAKRGGGARPADLDVETLAHAEGDDQFDRAWLANVVELAMQRLAAEFPCYSEAVRLGMDGASHAQIAAVMGCGAASVRNWLHRGRQKLVGYVKGEVWAYAGSYEEYADEMRRLASVLGKGAAGPPPAPGPR